LFEPHAVLDLEHPLALSPTGQSRSVLLALLIAALLHLGVLLLLPQQILRSTAPSAVEAQDMQLTLLPPQELSPEDLRFVEANPDAPENEPDAKDQYSFRSQQAASETLSDSPLNAPNVAGDTDSQKIIQGSLESAPPVAPGVYSTEAQEGTGDGTDGGDPGAVAQAAQQLAAPQPLPAPQFIQQKPVEDVGPGSRMDQPGLALEVFEQVDPTAPVEIYRQQDQPPVAAAQAGAGNGGAPAARPMPRARPRLAPELLTGPLMRSEGSARLRGTLAIDASFSEFGEYQQQFFAALQAGWYQEIEFFQPIDTATRVVVRFTIQSDGVVRDVEVVQSSASQIATFICESAITKRSPFRPWTKEMVQVFGQERSLTVAFHYR
jgi:hypothetical protein